MPNPRRLRDVGELPIQYRQLEVDDFKPVARAADAADDEPVTYEISCSSETEVERWYGIEILSHDRGSIDMSRAARGLAFLVDHNTRDVVGLLHDFRLDSDRKTRGRVQFSKSARAQEIEQDYRDGLRPYISIGYFVKKARLVEQRGDVDVWRMDLWQPAETSTVAVPADIEVGVGRGEGAGSKHPVEILEEDKAMLRGSRSFDANGGGGAGGGTAAADPPATERGVQITRESQDKAVKDAIAGERARQTEIREVAAVWGLEKEAEEWIREGLTIDRVNAEIVKAKRTKGEVQPAAESLQDLGASERDLREYRYSNAILGAVHMAEGKKFTGLEREVHDALTGRRPEKMEDRGGVLVPMRLRNSGLVGDPAPRERREMAALGMSTRAAAMMLRAGLDSKTLGKGAEVVYEQAGEMIEILRNYAAVLSMGARSLTGLTQPISFAKKQAGLTAYWVGENPPADVPDSDVTLGLVLMAMKTIQATTSWSRQFLMQASIDGEAMVREEIAAAHALLIDLAAIHGLGANGEPTGVYKAADVASQAIGGAMSYSLALDMQGKVALANAYRGSLGWLMHTTMATNLRKILDFPASSAGRPVWTGTYEDGEVAGYRAAATNQVSNTMTGSERTGGTELGAIFGNWQDMIVGGYGALEFVIDPYRLKKRAMIECTSFQGVDIVIRHGQSFCKATGATG